MSRLNSRPYRRHRPSFQLARLGCAVGSEDPVSRCRQGETCRPLISVTLAHSLTIIVSYSSTWISLRSHASTRPSRSSLCIRSRSDEHLSARPADHLVPIASPGFRRRCRLPSPLSYREPLPSDAFLPLTVLSPTLADVSAPVARWGG